MIDNRFEQYWRSTLYRPRLRYKLILSAILHVAAIGLVFGWLNFRPEKKPPEVFQIQIVQSTETTSDTPTERVAEPAPPEPETAPVPPEPEPPAPEPDPVPPPPEPDPVPPPPEPVVEKPKPPEENLEEKRMLEAEKKRLEAERKRLEEEKEKLEEEKKRKEAEEKKKLEEEKKKLEDEKKLEAEKKRKEAEEKKKLEDEKKRKEEEERKKREAEKVELERLAKNQAEITQGVEEAQLPHDLLGWAALVQRKVDRTWVLPAGIRLDEAGETIRVGFVVASNGDLMDGPTILQGTTQPALDQSCLNAIKASLPLPPFPTGFNQPEQYVVYVFRALP